MTRRVLIVDDDAQIREVAQLSLELVGGWEVLSADCGATAVAVAGSQRPDAILLDVMMPELDGPATLALLRSDDATCSIPVVFLTAKVAAGDVNRITALQAQGLIAKPCDPMALPALLSATLGWAE